MPEPLRRDTAPTRELAVRLPSLGERQRIYDEFPLLAERRRIQAGSLSGGEQQILTMAPLLLKPPTVLIADEPTLGLAPRIVEQILELLTQLRENGTAVLLAEEWARSVLDVADQVILLELGRLVWSGPRHSLDDQQLAAIFLGSASEVVSSTQAAQHETESAEVSAHADGSPP
jgi:ABC-type branched-subunit amino acid transport system ATPase component